MVWKLRIVERTIDETFLIFGYPEMNTVMRILKEENVEVLKQNMELDCI